jgi:ubiquinone/menaquinone biosynthesis C-methylase UbiE
LNRNSLGRSTYGPDTLSTVTYQRSKYLTRNRISQLLIRGFRSNLQSVLRELQEDFAVSQVVEIGCGEGITTSWLHDILGDARVTALDIHEPSIRIATGLCPATDYGIGDALHIPLRAKSADMVVMLEVLEHLQNPLAALHEVARVSRQWCVLSVPREPIWRMMNVARGAYWKALGNTPGHLNHWSSGAFARLVATEIQIVRTVTPLPWTIIAGRVW